MMRRTPLPGHRWREGILHRLDRTAAELNPLLFVVVVGLAIIYLACLIALGLSHVHIHHIP
jgi:hypothetical protein